MLAYLIHTFPLYSSTFVNDEVDEMRRQGMRPALFAVQRPAPRDYPPAFERFARETRYVFPVPAARFCARHLAALAGRPRAYLGCLGFILARKGLGARDRLRTLFHFAEAVHLYPELRARGCRHLHVHFLFGGAAIAYFLHRLHGLPYSLTAHGSDIFVDRVLHAEKLAHARFTLVATEYNAAFLRTALPADRRCSLRVIPFGVDRDKVPPARGREAGGTGGAGTGRPALRILSVGRLIWQKAQHLLLEACALAAERGFEFRLRLVGEGPLRPALEAKVRALGLEGRVEMPGALPHDAVWLEYREADLFVLSSVSEGSPFVILEALACGLPVIAPALHGIPEMVRDGADGRLFETGSSARLAEAMMGLMEDGELRARLGSAAAARAARFGLAESVAAFRELFGEPVGERPGPPAGAEGRPGIASNPPTAGVRA